jgi:hypothetical protein
LAAAVVPDFEQVKYDPPLGQPNEKRDELKADGQLLGPAGRRPQMRKN